MKIISRKEAQEQSLKYYFTGEPCKNGVLSERYVSDCGCICEVCKSQAKAKRDLRKDEIREYNKKYHQENFESISKRQKEYQKSLDKNEVREKAKIYWANNKDKQFEMDKRYRIKHKETIKIQRKEYRNKNKEIIALKKKLYYQENPHIKQISHARRRAMKKNATVTWDKEFTEFVLSNAYELKNRREKLTGFEWHVDHMIPMQAEEVCGLHVWSNLQVIPASINLSKNNRLILTEVGEWLNSNNNIGEPI